MHYAFDYAKLGVGIRPFPFPLVAPLIRIAIRAGLPLIATNSFEIIPIIFFYGSDWFIPIITCFVAISLRDSEVIPCRTIQVVIAVSVAGYSYSRDSW